jgi:hypothetical protein
MGIVLAWALGMGVIVYRSAARDHHIPVPGQLLAASGLFALLGIVAEYGPARPVAAVAAWGFDLAALLYQPNAQTPPLIVTLFGQQPVKPAPTAPRRAGPGTTGSSGQQA